MLSFQFFHSARAVGQLLGSGMIIGALLSGCGSSYIAKMDDTDWTVKQAAVGEKNNQHDATYSYPLVETIFPARNGDLFMAGADRNKMKGNLGSWYKHRAVLSRLGPDLRKVWTWTDEKPQDIGNLRILAGVEEPYGNILLAQAAGNMAGVSGGLSLVRISGEGQEISAVTVPVKVRGSIRDVFMTPLSNGDLALTMSWYNKSMMRTGKDGLNSVLLLLAPDFSIRKQLDGRYFEDRLRARFRTVLELPDGNLLVGGGAYVWQDRYVATDARLPILINEAGYSSNERPWLAVVGGDDLFPLSDRLVREPGPNDKWMKGRITGLFPGEQGQILAVGNIFHAMDVGGLPYPSVIVLDPAHLRVKTRQEFDPDGGMLGTLKDAVALSDGVLLLSHREIRGPSMEKITEGAWLMKIRRDGTPEWRQPVGLPGMRPVRIGLSERGTVFLAGLEKEGHKVTGLAWQEVEPGKGSKPLKAMAAE